MSNLADLKQSINNRLSSISKSANNLTATQGVSVPPPAIDEYTWTAPTALTFPGVTDNYISTPHNLLLRDLFGRSGDGWTLADTGQRWRTNVSTNKSVSNVGIIIMDSDVGVAQQNTIIVDAQTTEFDANFQCRIDQVPTGSALSIRVAVRTQSNGFTGLGDGYLMGIIWGTDGTISVNAGRWVSPTLSEIIPDTAILEDADADIWFNVRVRVVGFNFKIKVWKDGDPEPNEWSAEGDDLDLDNGFSSGYFGFDCVKEDTNTNEDLEIQFDNLVIRHADQIPEDALLNNITVAVLCRLRPYESQGIGTSPGIASVHGTLIGGDWAWGIYTSSEADEINVIFYPIGSGSFSTSFSNPPREEWQWFAMTFEGAAGNVRKIFSSPPTQIPDWTEKASSGSAGTPVALRPSIADLTLGRRLDAYSNVDIAHILVMPTVGDSGTPGDFSEAIYEWIATDHWRAEEAGENYIDDYNNGWTKHGDDNEWFFGPSIENG